MRPAKSQRMPATVIDRSLSSLIQDSELDPPIPANSTHEIASAATVKQESENLVKEWPSSASFECANPHAPSSRAVIQDSQMTFARFVEARFIPGHVQFKTRAGQIHYQAALKHLITPEAVNRIFNPGRMAQARLKSVPGWPYLDGVRLCDINSDHVRRLITAAGTAEYSSQSVRHIKNVFFAVISHAQREGCFNGPNPASLVKLPKIVRRDQHNLTFEQTKSILQILPSPLKEIALFAITTGMSLVEICRLQWKHVNLSDAERVVDGEPIPARTLAVRASGSSRSVCKSRNLEIHEPLFSTLKQLSPQNRNFKGNSLVIVSHEGEPILPSGVQAALSRQVAKASGLPWLTWQVLRRARSSFFAEFLSQLSAPSLSGDARISVRESNTLETRSDQRLCERASALDSCRRRTFCFGDRKQVPGEALRRWTRWTPTPEFAEDLVRG